MYVEQFFALFVIIKSLRLGNMSKTSRGGGCIFFTGGGCRPYSHILGGVYKKAIWGEGSEVYY